VYYALSKENSGQRPDIHPDGSYKLSFYVDSDFGGLFGSEDTGNTVSVKSTTWYLLSLGTF